MAPIPWFDIVLILALIALNGVFAMSELAIVSSREARLKALAKSGSAGAQVALGLAADPSRFLSTVQIGITLISILAGAYSGASLGGPLAERLIAYTGMDPDTAQTVGFTIVIVITTFLSLIIGELVPKQFALRSRKRSRHWCRDDGHAVASHGAVRVVARSHQRGDFGCSASTARARMW